MSPTATRSMRMTSGAIALALVAVSSLTCFVGNTQLSADAPRVSMPQHACCVGMNQKCPDAVSASQDDCCSTQSVSTTAIHADHAASPLARLSATFVSVPPLRNVAGSFDTDLLKSSSPPPYLLDVVFRI